MIIITEDCRDKMLTNGTMMDLPCAPFARPRQDSAGTLYNIILYHIFYIRTEPPVAQPDHVPRVNTHTHALTL